MTKASSKHRQHAAALAAASVVYFALLLFRYRTVPDGITIDAAEEALHGVQLVQAGRLEVLTFAASEFAGPIWSAESLWLYILGLSAKLLGPSVLAIVLPSALAATAVVILVTLLARTLDPETPWPVPFLLAAGSPWLFHYGRSGLRAIAAPLFVSVTALLFARAVRHPGRGRPFAWVGAAAAASVYGYTAGRLLPVALALTLATAWRRERQRRGEWLSASRQAAAGFAVASIPNLLFFAARPREFLTRGSYVADTAGSAGGRLANLVATALLPFHYPDRYRFAFGDAHAFDGVGASLTGSGIDPVPLLAGLLAAGGLVLAVRRRREPVVFLLLALHVLAVLGLGAFGPSLTRLLLLVPGLVVWATLAVGALARTPRARLGAAAVLAVLAAAQLRAYFVRLSDPARQSRNEVAQVPTAMGERARALALAGRGRVVAIVAERPNVARYLAWGTDVVVLDFWERPFDAREVAAVLPARTLLVEKTPLYAPFAPSSFVETPSPDPRWRELTAVR